MSTFAARVTVAFGALVTATTAVLLLIGGWLLHRQLIGTLESLHDLEGAELRELITSQPDLTPDELARRIEAEADSDMALFYIQVHRDNGTLYFRSDNLGETILPTGPTSRRRIRMDLPEQGPLLVSEYTTEPWHIQIGSRLTPVHRVVRDYAQVSALLVLVAAGVSAVLGYGFSRFVLRPVRAIEQTARCIRADNLGERIPVPPGHDELSSLARLLNQMFDRLQVAFTQIQRFTADASHELKTPLTLIRLHGEKLRPRLSQQPAVAASCDELLEEVGRLQHIVDLLLFLSRAESGALPLQLRAFVVADWVKEIAEDGQALAEDRGVRFELGRNDRGSGWGDPALLRQLILNLLSNALRFAAGEVTLTSEATDEGWVWTVTDDGPGVPPDKLEWIFDRFTRVPRASETGEPGGHGLGLAICRSIAELHRGTIKAANREGRAGLLVQVTLPRAVEKRDGGGLGRPADSVVSGV